MKLQVKNQILSKTATSRQNHKITMLIVVAPIGSRWTQTTQMPRPVMALTFIGQLLLSNMLEMFRNWNNNYINSDNNNSYKREQAKSNLDVHILSLYKYLHNYTTLRPVVTFAQFNVPILTQKFSNSSTAFHSLPK